MKFTLSWLREHLETDATVAEIADTLTMIGLEVDGVSDRAAGLDSFVVARVVEARPHPNADKLRVCTVDAGGSMTVDVVCGAPNARTGMKGVFAATGAFVPGTGITLKQATIRGVESNGMLLSEREMGISEDHEGIVELAEDAPVGAPAVEVMGLADPVFDVGVTPNRGDCLGVRGIARDVAAAGLGTLKPLNAEPVPGSYPSPIRVHLDFDADTADACPYFVGRYIRGVRNGESPDWVKARLAAVGLRPISALVDITNLLTLDVCRPLHAFDADKVHGDIHARLARDGETLRTLNERDYTLDPEMTVIADDESAEALGGVMGGEVTACTADTVNVFLEAALFDPVRTAATGRKLNLPSDARYRFERGIDPEFLVPGMEMATRLVLDFCGGEASEIVVAGGPPKADRSIELRPARVRDLGGVEVGRGEIERILTALGFTVTGGGSRLAVTPPSWRGDIVGEACLVEEVVRIHGYDQVSVVPMERSEALPHAALTPEQRRRVAARRTLAARGLVEAVTFSFVSSAQAELFGGVSDAVRLVNPISSDLDVMRPSLLPNLIAACGRNADRGIADAALFEVGPRYAGDRPEDQAMVAAGVRSGRSGHRHWSSPPRPVDVFDAKADALSVLDAAAVPSDQITVTTDAPAWYHPGRSGVLRLGPNVLAAFGEVHPRVLGKMDVRGPLAAFEVVLDSLPRRKARAGAARAHLELSTLHPVERDFAFVVDEGVAADAVVRAARNVDKALIAKVRVFDVFSGGNLGTGSKSIAITVVLQPEDRTLTDAEIEAIATRVVESVSRATGGTLRS